MMFLQTSRSVQTYRYVGIESRFIVHPREDILCWYFDVFFRKERHLETDGRCLFDDCKGEAGNLEYLRVFRC
jgi:hypothetical protein